MQVSSVPSSETHIAGWTAVREDEIELADHPHDG
jgi:hypothetical protein